MVLVHQGSIFNVSTLVALIYCLTSSLVFKPYGVLNKTSHTSKLLWPEVNVSWNCLMMNLVLEIAGTNE